MSIAPAQEASLERGTRSRAYRRKGTFTYAVAGPPRQQQIPSGTVFKYIRSV